MSLITNMHVCSTVRKRITDTQLTTCIHLVGLTYCNPYSKPKCTKRSSSMYLLRFRRIDWVSRKQRPLKQRPKTSKTKTSKTKTSKTKTCTKIQCQSTYGFFVQVFVFEVFVFEISKTKTSKTKTSKTKSCTKIQYQSTHGLFVQVFVFEVFVALPVVCLTWFVHPIHPAKK